MLKKTTNDDRESGGVFFLRVQIEEEKRNGENGQGDVQPTPRSNEKSEEKKNQFANGKEILDDDAGEQTLFRSDWKRKGGERRLATRRVRLTDFCA